MELQALGTCVRVIQILNEIHGVFLKAIPCNIFELTDSFSVCRFLKHHHFIEQASKNNKHGEQVKFTPSDMGALGSGVWMIVANKGVHLPQTCPQQW
jgi:hypothetical protein